MRLKHLQKMSLTVDSFSCHQLSGLCYKHKPFHVISNKELMVKTKSTGPSVCFQSRHSFSSERVMMKKEKLSNLLCLLIVFV